MTEQGLGMEDLMDMGDHAREEAARAAELAHGPECEPPEFALTNDNYHSTEANAKYMSHSQYASWITCAAREAALQAGEYKEKEKTAYIGGRYAHVALLEPHRIAELQEAHPGIVKAKELTTDELKALAAGAECDLKGHMKSKATILARLAECEVELPPPEMVYGTDFKWMGSALPAFTDQEVFVSLLERGTPEVIITFTLGGVEWRAMLDNVRVDDEQFDDLKFMAGFDDKWSAEAKRYVHWFELYHYDRQMAIYREATRQEYGTAFTPNILAASKQDPADVDWIQFSGFGEHLDSLVLAVAADMQLVKQWKSGELPPPRCGKSSCLYCRETKVLTRPRVPTPIG